VPATGIHREDEDFGCLEGALGVAKFAEGNASDVLDFDNSADGRKRSLGPTFNGGR
jgi:hypothetical protein